MAGAKVEITLDDAPIVNYLRELTRKKASMSMVMGTIAEAMHAAVMDSFENQESPDGEKWEPSMRTLIEGGKTLIDRGILKNSLHPHHTRDSAEVGTNIVYAAVHQFGSDFSIRSNRRRVTLPARPYLGFSLDLVNEIEETLLDLLRA